MLGIEGHGLIVAGVVLRAFMVGDGFHALHWNMFSWFGCFVWVLRGFFFGWVERDVGGGWGLCPGRVVVGWVLGGWGSMVCGSDTLGFFGGFCDSIGGGGCL